MDLKEKKDEKKWMRRKEGLSVRNGLEEEKDKEEKRIERKERRKDGLSMRRIEGGKGRNRGQCARRVCISTYVPHSLDPPPLTRSLPRLSISPILFPDFLQALPSSRRGLPRADFFFYGGIASDEGTRTCYLKSSNMKETEALGTQSKEEEVSQITEANASMLSDKLVPGTAGKSSLEQDAAYLSLGQVGPTNSSENVGCIVVSECKETSGSCFPAKVDEGHECNKLNSAGIGVDLNAVEVSSMVEQNPFYPYKKLGQVKSVDASESGSTTGPVEDSEPLRMWKEMKQNGFLSSSHGGIPMPKQRCCQPRKRKDEFRRKAEFARREQANRFTKIAAPSGLLSGLNPGIINHVRNSKQVHSIIEAIVRSEKLDGQMQNRFTDQMSSESNGTNERRKEHSYAHGLATNQLNLSLNKLSVPSSLDRGVEMNIAEDKFCRETSTTSQLSTKDDSDVLTLKLSPATTETTENASGASTDCHSANQDNITSLSLKAATVASQWLDLLQQDIKGRLAALRRSRKRVRNAIQTELPYLLSTEFSFNQENDPSSVHSSEAQCLKKPTLEMHVARWRSLFSQMDKALYEEGKHLENWLKQVQEMQLHCEKGLKYVCVEGLSQFGSSENSSKLKKSEAHEQEYAVRAAAASIYSTCNLIMTTENVPCF
uniref:Uncharacterized protein LOC105047499 n=1 Tax=Elaeis guineensis var. tenera TaxID=51953 RepID=A0A6I9RDD3_ELAGV|nr:uncharacterized protein LOC105047499 [Elaeis guineensis]